MRLLRVAFTVLVGSTLLASCASADAADEAEPVAAADVTGTWGASAVEGEASLDLADDGAATGTDGCNRMVGEWRLGDDGVVFSSWATTRMSCPAVDPWLSLAVAARLEGDHLVFVDKDAVQLGTLTRTDGS